MALSREIWTARTGSALQISPQRALTAKRTTPIYVRVPRFLRELSRAKGDGTYPKRLASLAKTELLVLDDFGTAPLNDEHRHDLLEILEDRYGLRSTLVTSQYPIERWHELVGDPTLADAILDRLVHNAYKLSLKGESMRKKPKKGSPN